MICEWIIEVLRTTTAPVDRLPARTPPRGVSEMGEVSLFTPPCIPYSLFLCVWITFSGIRAVTVHHTYLFHYINYLKWEDREEMPTAPTTPFPSPQIHGTLTAVPAP